MKNTALTSIITLIILLQISCNRDIQSYLDLKVIARVVDETNIERPLLDPARAEIIKGAISHEIIQKDEGLFHVFKVEDRSGKNIVYRFQLEEDTKPQVIPDMIVDGVVVIFKEQLIVQDKAKKEVYSFLVGDCTFKVKLEQTVSGIGLFIKKSNAE
jgi:hypothetical protein